MGMRRVRLRRHASILLERSSRGDGSCRRDADGWAIVAGRTLGPRQSLKRKLPAGLGTTTLTAAARIHLTGPSLDEPR